MSSAKWRLFSLGLNELIKVDTSDWIPQQGTIISVLIVKNNFLLQENIIKHLF